MVSRPAIEVHPLPTEADDFTTPHSAGAGEQPHRVQAIVLAVVEEPAELLGRPRLHLASLHRRRVSLA